MEKLLFEKILADESKITNENVKENTDQMSVDTLFSQFNILSEDEQINENNDRKIVDFDIDILDDEVNDVSKLNTVETIEENDPTIIESVVSKSNENLIKDVLFERRIQNVVCESNKLKVNFERKIEKMLDNTNINQNDVNDPVLKALLDQINMVQSIKEKVLNNPNISVKKLSELESILDRNLSILGEK